MNNEWNRRENSHKREKMEIQNLMIKKKRMRMTGVLTIDDVSEERMEMLEEIAPE